MSMLLLITPRKEIVRDILRHGRALSAHRRITMEKAKIHRSLPGRLRLSSSGGVRDFGHDLLILGVWADAKELQAVADLYSMALREPAVDLQHVLRIPSHA